MPLKFISPVMRSFLHNRKHREEPADEDCFARVLCRSPAIFAGESFGSGGRILGDRRPCIRAVRSRESKPQLGLWHLGRRSDRRREDQFFLRSADIYRGRVCRKGANWRIWAWLVSRTARVWSRFYSGV